MHNFGLKYFGMANERQGIVHIIGPEQGFSLPGTTYVCVDSHTTRHEAFVAMAFGISTLEVEHALTTSTLSQVKSQNILIRVDGTLDPGVISNDIVPHICCVIGMMGGINCAIEFMGSVVRAQSMEARMSISSMAIGAGVQVV